MFVQLACVTNVQFPAIEQQVPLGGCGQGLGEQVDVVNRVPAHTHGLPTIEQFPLAASQQARVRPKHGMVVTAVPPPDWHTAGSVSVQLVAQQQAFNLMGEKHGAKPEMQVVPVPANWPRPAHRDGVMT